MSTGYGEQIVNSSSLMWTINANRNFRAGVGVRCSQGERTHVQIPNPGSRRARLAGAIHRDDRHLDPGTGKFVTVPVAINTERFPGVQRVEVRRPALVEKHPAHDAVGCTALPPKVQCLPQNTGSEAEVALASVSLSEAISIPNNIQAAAAQLIG